MTVYIMGVVFLTLSVLTNVRLTLANKGNLLTYLLDTGRRTMTP